MTGQIQAGPIHHLRLTVTDLQRSRRFYTGVLGFTVVVEAPAADDPPAAAVSEMLFGGVVMARDGLTLGLRPVAPSRDRFDEDRVGLDHLSFSVASREELEQAAGVLDDHGVAHGEITGMASFGIYVLPFRDPDNIQLELTAPMS
jgi:glyoxylase I family protein